MKPGRLLFAMIASCVLLWGGIKSSQVVTYHSEFWCIIDKDAEVFHLATLASLHLSAPWRMYRKIPGCVLLPKYEKYGRKAPLLRNIQIVDNCNFVLAFWYGVRRGTRFSIDYAIKRRVPYKVVSIV